MEFEIRRLRPEELEKALFLAMDTFLRFEAPDYGSEGITSFRRDIIDNARFHEDCRTGANRMWGAFDGEELVGLFAMRGLSHICLVFTHHAYHRKGIATSIFRTLLDDVRRENPDLTRLTLNSSPYGKPFYLHAGFQPTDVELCKDGIVYTPMEYIL